MDLERSREDELLIKLVEQNALIYNRRHPEFKSMNKKLKTWALIGNEIGLNGEQCAKRWTTLRERYVKECRKLTNDTSSIKEMCWPHFESMSFIKPYIIARRTRSCTNCFNISSNYPCLSPASATQAYNSGAHSPPLSIKSALASSTQSLMTPMHSPPPQNSLLPTQFPLIMLRSPHGSLKPERTSDNECEETLEENKDMFDNDSEPVYAPVKHNTTSASEPNDMVKGFGQMIVGIIASMSDRKKMIAMRALTDLVVSIQLEPDERATTKTT